MSGGVRPCLPSLASALASDAFSPTTTALRSPQFKLPGSVTHRIAIRQNPLMDGSTVQLLTASVGVAGTLAASVLTQALGRRVERDRRKSEDQSRWLAERQRVAAQLIASALVLERQLWSACAFMDDDERTERLGGYTSIHMVPDEGLEGIIDSVELNILGGMLEETDEPLRKLEVLVAELALIGEPNEAKVADQLLDSFLVAMSIIESFQSSHHAFQAVLTCKSNREQLIQESRKSLRVDAKPVDVSAPRQLKGSEESAEQAGPLHS